MKFNVNEKVRIKLLPHGREILEKIHRNIYSDFTDPPIPYTPPEEDEDGWSTWQMWYLMQQLGPHCNLGQLIPFESEIEIIT